MNADLISHLRDDLRSADFTVDSLTALWGNAAADALHRGHRVPALRAIDGATSALSTLARLFVLGMPASPSSIAAALPALGLDGAVTLGLVDNVGAPLRDLRPYSIVDSRGVASWWIASDLGELALGRAIDENHVLGVGGASMTLASLMVSGEVDTALDLGTGCGIQALHLARHARRVVATDISQRALDLAAFNAELNDIHSIEFRLGSLFEPVIGERFDHIVSNPPFVITPRVEGVPDYEYRDGGMVGDALVASVIDGVADHLTPGGIAQMLGNWEYTLRDGLDRVSQWCRDTGLDAWIVERERQTPEQYAETWIRDGGTRPGPDFDLLSTAWLDDFASRKVNAVGFGYLTLRKPVGGVATFFRAERVDATPGSSLGEHISAVLALHDALEALGDDGLFDAVLEVAPDVTEERHYWPGEEHPTVMQLKQGAGFARTMSVGTVLAAVVGACDGSMTLGVICDAVADLLEIDGGELREEVLPQVRELVAVGMLLPTGR